jgi:hypothetical protein
MDDLVRPCCSHRSVSQQKGEVMAEDKQGERRDVTADVERSIDPEIVIAGVAAYGVAAHGTAALVDSLSKLKKSDPPEQMAEPTTTKD